MLSETRYFITSNSQLAASIDSLGVASFLQIDPERSSDQVFFVFSNLAECKKAEQNFLSGSLKVNPGAYTQSYKKFVDMAVKFKKGGSFYG